MPFLAALGALTLIVVAAFGAAYQLSFLGAYGVGFATFHLDIANLASWGLTPALLFALTSLPWLVVRFMDLRLTFRSTLLLVVISFATGYALALSAGSDRMGALSIAGLTGMISVVATGAERTSHGVLRLTFIAIAALWLPWELGTSQALQYQATSTGKISIQASSEIHGLPNGNVSRGGTWTYANLLPLFQDDEVWLVAPADPGGRDAWFVTRSQIISVQWSR